MELTDVLQQILGKLDALEKGQAKREANQMEFRAEVNARFDRINHRFEALEQDMREMHVILECRLPQQIQLIAEQYGDVIKNQKALELAKERNAQTRDRVAILENVVKEHTAAIAELQTV